MTDMVFCRGCGKEIHKTARTCPACGAPQISGGQKSKVVAGVLALFLGGLGIHRFYLRQWWGIFYLLFFWTGIPAIIAFIEGIVFLCTSDESWDERYNQGVPSSGGGAGVVIAVVVGIFGLVFIVGILAAIAIPAYQDYTTRAKTVDAIRSASAAAKAVGSYIEKTHNVPDNIEETGFSEPLSRHIQSLSIDKRSGTLTVTMTGSPVDGKAFSLAPAVGQDRTITWRCSPGEIPRKYMPASCRD